jgi:hypothetical protein
MERKMFTIVKPKAIELPTRYAVKLAPGRTVRVRTIIDISVAYDRGGYEQHRPRLEFVSGPGIWPETPEELFETLVERGNTPKFRFVPEAVGIYSLRLIPFISIPVGEFITIHSVSEEEEQAVAAVMREFGSSPDAPVR